VKETVIRRFLLLGMTIVLFFLSSQTFAYGSHGGGMSCQSCAGTYDPGTRTAVVNCADVGDNQWGSSRCTINCMGRILNDGTEYGTCTCDDTREMCLVIVVTPQ
jgi:hypothetical protein